MLEEALADHGYSSHGVSDLHVFHFRADAWQKHLLKRRHEPEMVVRRMNNDRIGAQL